MEYLIDVQLLTFGQVLAKTQQADASLTSSGRIKTIKDCTYDFT
jgi:hypothetical protein